MSTPMLDPAAVLKIDGYLRPHIPAIIQRHNRFRQWKNSFELHEGGYEKFTRGYEKFGFNVGPANEVTYREWAPNAREAYLIGEFSQCSIFFREATLVLSDWEIDEWSRTSHPMKVNDFGVWEITVPPLRSGRCAIPHDSKVKVGNPPRKSQVFLY